MSEMISWAPLSLDKAARSVLLTAGRAPYSSCYTIHGYPGRYTEFRRME